MICKECSYEAPCIARTDEEEFITSIPAWWVDKEIRKEDRDVYITVAFKCPKCGVIQ